MNNPLLSPINQLEPYIDHLIFTCHELRRENELLREQLRQSEAEKSQLFTQKQQATTQIKQVISQLREEIHERSA